jgi:hypothetical protein
MSKNGEKIIAAEESTLNAQDKLRRVYAKSQADFERQYNIKTWEQRKNDELRILERQHEEGLLSDEVYQLALVAVDRKYEDEKFKVRQQYNLVDMQEMYDKQLEALKLQHEQGLLMEEEYERAKLDIKLRYAEELAKKEAEFAQVGADTVQALEEAETAHLSAEYTKRESALTEQYNKGILSQEQYNAQKEQLDYEQRVKELEVQKKYADVNFAMQAAQIVATGAMAAIQAFSSMAAIPIVGPILGAVAAAAVAVTTALQLSKAKSERDRVKAMTLEAPGGGSSGAARTGSIQMKPGFSEGGSNTPDFSEGGFTGDGGKYEVAGTLPVHHGEYVVDTESLKYPDVVDKVRAIEQVRRNHSSRNPLPEGFADGGSNTPDVIGAGWATLDRKNGERIAAILERLESGNIVVQTNYGITELEAEQRKKIMQESNFTLQN